MKDVAICVVGYNRPSSVMRLLRSLNDAEYSEYRPVLYISIDKSEDMSVLSVANDFEWKFGLKHVIAREQKLGLRQHILRCGDFLQKHDALIMLEDDVVVSKSFYLYATQCVEKYCDDDAIAGISLYGFSMNFHNHLPFCPISSDSDVYLMQLAQSWGQVWMKKQWNDFVVWYENFSEDEFSLNPSIPTTLGTWPKSSWLKYHIKYCIEKNKFFIYPYMSMSTCFSDAGVHTRVGSTSCQTPILYSVKDRFHLDPSIVYDAFFESISVKDVLKEYSYSLCIDFYGEKNNMEGSRYWLTRKILDYKVVQSFGLDYKPYELNIILDNKGEELFLYDTSVLETNRRKNAHIDRTYYYYLFNFQVDKNAWELWDHLKRILSDKIRKRILWKK